MGTELRAKDLTDWNAGVGSMARAIEEEMELQVPYGANEDKAGRKKLALAIARGVIRHLNDNEGAFTVVVPAGPLPKTVTVNINVQL